MTQDPPRKKVDLRSVSLAPDSGGTEEGQGPGEAEENEAAPEGAPPEERDAESLAGAVEALLFVSDEPLSAAQLSRAIGGTSAAEVRRAAAQLAQQYEETQRAFELVDISGGR